MDFQVFKAERVFPVLEATYCKVTMQRRYTSIAEESESATRTAGGKISGKTNFVSASKTSKQTLTQFVIMVAG